MSGLGERAVDRQALRLDPRQADPVRAHTVQLFRELKAMHDLPPEYGSWLATAAVLRDTGKFASHQGHHRHTQYIISSSEIYGYTQLQRTRWSRPSRATWERAAPSRAIVRCATFPPTSTKTSTAPWSCCVSPLH